MLADTSTAAKFEVLETLLRQGYQSDLIDRTLEKIIALETENIRKQLSDILSKIRRFEKQYEMTSEDFYRSYERGEMGDSVDFMEWSSLYDMSHLLEHHLALLTR
jgi:hypothetical protein